MQINIRKDLNNQFLQIIGTEWITIIFLVIFLLFGSKKIPELSRALGKAMSELQKGRQEIEREFKLASLDSSSMNNPINGPIYRSKYARAAENIGIDSKGKSDASLRKEIIDRLNEKQEFEDSNNKKQKTNRVDRPE